jgi:hypothetical protein
MTRRAFGSLYADDTEAALSMWARNPGPVPEASSFSAWSALSAGAKGLPSAALERAGSIADVLSGFATAAAASGGTGQGMFSVPTADESKQEAEARDRMLKGDAFDTAAGNALRRKADEFAPNPETAHTADRVMHGLVKNVAKAVADISTMGPAGAVVFGAEAGNTDAQRLIEQGVDPVTAAKVGVTTAAVQGASVALPAVGPTIGKTIGRALAGGPVSYVAQEGIARKILQEASYSDLAAQHDPFDPLGLTLSTVIPGVIGGVHIRGLKKTAVEDVVKHIESGGRRYGKDGELLTSAKGAQGEMQVMPNTAKDPGFGVTPARDNSPEELARVGRDYLAAMQQRYGGDTDKALAAYNAGPGAVDAAVKKGGADWLKSMPEETKAYVAKANKLLGEATAAKGAEDPAVVDAARVKVADEALARSLPDTPTAHADVLKATDEIAAGRMPDVPPVRDIDLPTFRDWFGGSKVVDERGEPLVMYHGTGSNVEAFDPGRPGPHADIGAVFLTADPSVAGHYAQAGAMFGDRSPNVIPAYVRAERPFDYENAAQRAAIVDRVFETTPTHVQGDGQKALILDGKQTLYTKGVLDAGLADGRNWALIEQKPIQDAIKGLGHDGFYVNEDTKNLAVYDPSQVKSAIGNSGKFDPNSPSLTDPLRPGEVNPRDVARDAAGNALPRPDSVSLEPETARASGDTKADDGGADQARLKQLLDERPDLKVRLPGSEETVPVEEALLRAHEAYDEEVSFAQLVKVAAECALMNGA